MSQESNPNKTEAVIAASQIGRNENIQGVSALPFFPIKDYTTFDAEFTLKDGDLVLHFYPSAEVKSRADGEKYWKQTFPTCLERIAKQVFEADYPQISAQYIHEPSLGVENSWWFKADGVGMLLDPHAKTYKFLDALDESLEAASISQ